MTHQVKTLRYLLREGTGPSALQSDFLLFLRVGNLYSQLHMEWCPFSERVATTILLKGVQGITLHCFQ